MISITFSVKKGVFTGFEASGHALYDKKGRDIVCAAASVLIINTINAIDSINGEKFDLAKDEDEGIIIFNLLSEKHESTQTLLKALELGLLGIQTEYGDKYIKLNYREVT